MRAPLIAAGVAATALAAWLLSPHGERGRRASAAGVTTQHDANDEKVAALGDRIALLEREAAARRSAPTAPPPAATAAPEAAEAADRAPPPRPQPRTGNDHFHGLEQHFGRQHKDPAWSAEAEASIARAFQSGVFAGSSITRAECGTTLCRVDVAHDNAVAQHDFLGAVRTTPPFDGGGFAHRVVEPDGSVRTIVYMPREGQALPGPDDT